MKPADPQLTFLSYDDVVRLHPYSVVAPARRALFQQVYPGGTSLGMPSVITVAYGLYEDVDDLCEAPAGAAGINGAALCGPNSRVIWSRALEPFLVLTRVERSMTVELAARYPEARRVVLWWRTAEPEPSFDLQHAGLKDAGRAAGAHPHPYVRTYGSTWTLGPWATKRLDDYASYYGLFNKPQLRRLPASVSAQGVSEYAAVWNVQVQVCLAGMGGLLY